MIKNLLDAIKETKNFLICLFGPKITNTLIIIIGLIIFITILIKKIIPYCVKHKHTSIPYEKTYIYHLINYSKTAHFFKNVGFISIELFPVIIQPGILLILMKILSSLFNHVKFLHFLNTSTTSSAIICSFILLLINSAIFTLYIYWINALFKKTKLPQRMNYIYPCPWWIFMFLSELTLALFSLVVIAGKPTHIMHKYALIMLITDSIIAFHTVYVNWKFYLKYYKEQWNKIFKKIHLFALITVLLLLLVCSLQQLF